MPILVNLDVLLARRKMTRGALAAICQGLGCQPADLLEHRPGPEAE